MEERRPFWLDVDGGDTIQFLEQVYEVTVGNDRFDARGDGQRGSGSSGGRGAGEGARRHVARPAACSVSAVGMAVSVERVERAFVRRRPIARCCRA
jgi:hypothetical protein